MVEERFREKVASRKFILMLMIFSFGTICLLLPLIINFLSGTGLSSIMTGGEYVSLIIGTYAIYSGANVAQKKISTSVVPQSTISHSQIKVEDSDPLPGRYDDMMGD